MRVVGNRTDWDEVVMMVMVVAADLRP